MIMKNIVEEIDLLITKIKLEEGKHTPSGRFGFNTLVEELRGEKEVELHKKARQRYLKNENENSIDYLRLKGLYEDAQKRYFGGVKLQKLPPDYLANVDSVSLDAVREFSKQWDERNLKGRK